MFPNELASAASKRKLKKKDSANKVARVQIDALKDDEDEEKTDKKSETSDTENDEDENAVADDDLLEEEENDYMQSYFDNGEAFAEGSDDNMDEGPTY